MGCVCSKQLEGRMHEEITLLASQTFFSEAEVEVLHELFIKLTSCLSNDNLLTKEIFQFILIKNTNRRSLSADRIFGLFDMRNDGAIDFGEFVHTLNIFHPNSSQRDKAIFAFRLYDTRQTGFIEPEEVKEMIIDVLEESELMLSESIIDSIVSKTFEEADWKKDGKIDLEEWENFVANYPLTLKNMTIPFLKDIPRIFPTFFL
ncbi:EF-hand domain [Arabidopsis thaliana x Arabidopsis arenosa]|uniref:Calcineurin B-like protein n=1 Tax=Arabidopsis thaliana x Arabidopsis arenosa TaxID=1240361 RepID=A0A8T1Z391_9BRAS|nr:EF-hand domain [Arabidopsis thaliana x Arabidopsis arenosa]